MNSGKKFVFKVVSADEWTSALRRGTYDGSDDDRRDGFIHLCTLVQLAGTLARHFHGCADLVLIKLDAGALGDELRWEPSRGGDLFPHLYAELPVSAARATYTLGLSRSGVPAIPKDLAPC